MTPRFLPESAGVVWRRVLLSTTIVVAGVCIQRAEPTHLQAQDVSLHGLGALLDGSGFVQIPAGEFLMGARDGAASEQPVHRVRISKRFEMGKLEVTQAQWQAVMGSAHPSRDPGRGANGEAAAEVSPSHFKGPTLPVETVSWNDVQRFLTTLNARDTKYVYRLPTEAEWEYASRAGSTGDSTGNLSDIAWFEANAGGQPQPAGQKRPNAWGLLDMQGNLSEWVSDWYGFDYYADSPTADPTGPESGSYRVFRGCSWLSPAADCRSALRLFNFPIDGYYNVGFRLVRTPK
jgi:formylglycine-generating enzyme required for sulfatase activity